MAAAEENDCVLYSEGCVLRCMWGREKKNAAGRELDVAFWAQLNPEQKATSNSCERVRYPSQGRMCVECARGLTHQIDDTACCRD
jgi:hypothetical protein